MAEPQGDAKLHDDEAESDGGTELKDSKAESHGGDSEDASEGGAKLHGGETWYGDWQAAEVKAVRPRAEIELRQMIVKRHARNCYSSVISEDDNEIEFDATKISLPNACRLPLNAAIWAAEDSSPAKASEGSTSHTSSKMRRYYIARHREHTPTTTKKGLKVTSGTGTPHGSRRYTKSRPRSRSQPRSRISAQSFGKEFGSTSLAASKPI